MSDIGRMLGAKIAEAHEAHKDTPVEYGNQRIPEGIENGVAKLVVMTYGDYKDDKMKGKKFFRAAAVVVEPKSVVVKDDKGNVTAPAKTVRRLWVRCPEGALPAFATKSWYEQVLTANCYAPRVAKL
jgi:hypothetical protein